MKKIIASAIAVILIATAIVGIVVFAHAYNCADNYAKEQASADAEDYYNSEALKIYLAGCFGADTNQYWAELRKNKAEYYDKAYDYYFYLYMETVKNKLNPFAEEETSEAEA